MRFEIVRELILNDVSILTTRNQDKANFIKGVKDRRKRMYQGINSGGDIVAIKTTVNKVYYQSSDLNVKSSVDGRTTALYQFDVNFERELQIVDNSLAREFDEFRTLQAVADKIRKYKAKTSWRNVKGLFEISEEFDKLDSSLLGTYKHLTGNDIDTKATIKEIKKQVNTLTKEKRYSEFERLTPIQMKAVLMIITDAPQVEDFKTTFGPGVI